MDSEEVYVVENTAQKQYRRKPRKIEHEWWPNDIERLIQLVEGLNFLWDPKHCHYKDKSLREQTFENIAEELQRSVNDCKQKWENLRVQFRGYYAKQKKQKNGQAIAENYKVKWQYFEAMSFLIAVYETTNTDNLSDDSSQSSMSDFLTPTAKKQKRKADQAESSMINDKCIVKALSVLDKQSDSAQIFGDYVADRLRRIKEGPAEVLKEKITLLILQTMKAERNSVSNRELHL